MPKVSRSILVKTLPEKVFRTVLDFEKYPDFLPDVRSAVVQKKKGKKLIVAFEIEIIKPILYSLEITPFPEKRIEWKLVEGSFFKKNEGYWLFEPKGKGLTQATYTIEIALGMFVPGVVTRKLVESNLPKMLESFKKRVEAS